MGLLAAALAVCLAGIMTDQPATQAYSPRGGADKLWRCRDFEVLYDGPAGTGKTRAALEKLYVFASNHPGTRCLLLRKIRASMTETVLVTWEQKVLPPYSALLDGPSRAQRDRYTMANGTVIVVGGLDHAGKVLSSEYDFVLVNQAEEITEDDWETVSSRCRWGVAPYRQMIAECNPAHPGHWLMRRHQAGRMTRILSRHEDNPTCTPEYLATLSRLTGHRRARLFLGQWAAAEGLIYDRWDEAVFVRPRKGKWKRAILPIDAGYSNPCTGALWLLDGDDHPHVYREWYRSGMIVADVLRECERMKALARKRFGLDLEAVVVDPSAAELIEELGRAGFPVHPADNEVLPGIQSMQERLTLDDMGAPRMTYDPECKDSIREIGSYHWQPNKDGQATDKPAKVDDHAMDRDRYASRYVDATSGSMEVIRL